MPEIEARDAVIAAALRVLSAERPDREHANSDADAEFADDMLIEAARALVAATADHETRMTGTAGGFSLPPGRAAPHLTEAEFDDLTARILLAHPEYRPGQAASNVAHLFVPDAAKSAERAGLDPFNYDDRIPEFRAYVLDLSDPDTPTLRAAFAGDDEVPE